MQERNLPSDRAARPSPPPVAGRSRRVLFRLGAVLVGVLPVVALEIALRLADAGSPADFRDPVEGFVAAAPLFERDGAVVRTTRAHAPYIASQEFPAEKPPGAFRIFCFGGSTVYGHPYLGDTAFPKWLELELAGADPTRAWQAINCGGVSYASYRIVPLVREALQHQPDLIIVATGHNEFLEDRGFGAWQTHSAAGAWIQRQAASLRIVSLARGWLAPKLLDAAVGHEAALGPTVSTMLDNVSGYATYHRDEAWRRHVAAQYDASVRAIVAACRAARVPVLLVRLGSNLRDCPPFKSEHRAGLAPEPEADWQAAFDLATAAEATDPARALHFYREAAALDGEHALLNYRIARLLDRMGRAAEARAYFVRAKDEDVCPLRIVTPVDEALVRIADESGVPLVDAAGLLAARSPDGIPGFEWYVDHVHPTIGGHQAIARAVAGRMRESGWLDRSAGWPDERRQEAFSRHLAGLPPAYLADGRRRLGWLDKWAQRQRLAAETLPKDARDYVRLGFRQFDLGDDDDASRALAEGVRRDAGLTEAIRERARELAVEGMPQRAAILLQHARTGPAPRGP